MQEEINKVCFIINEINKKSKNKYFIFTKDTQPYIAEGFYKDLNNKAKHEITFDNLEDFVNCLISEIDY